MNGIKRVSAYLRDFKRDAVLAPVFKLLEALMDLVTPLLVARIINDGIADHDFPLVVRCFALMIGLAVLGMGFSFLAQWFAARASIGCVTQIRKALFDHIEGLSYSELDRLGTDTLITRMTSDINQVQNGVNLTLRLLLRSPFIVFGAVILAFTVDLRSAIVFVVTVPILSVVIFGIMAATIPLYRKSQEALDRLLGTTRENLTGVRVIRAFNKEQDETAEFDRENAALTKMNEFVGKLSALMNPATYAIINIATIFLIWQGAIQVNAGHLEQGSVVALYNYMAQIIVELIKLANLIININRSVACADRIDGVFRIKSSMSYPITAAESGEAAASEISASILGKETSNRSAEDDFISFIHVSFRYAESEADALTDLDFTVKRGETIGVIGGTGSGKSTLISLIPRFYDATEGHVLIGGRDVREYPEGTLIQRIGMVPQRAVLFEGTIRENLCFGRSGVTDAELWNAIETAQAEDVVKNKPGELDAMIEQNGRNLSGGQRQRLTIARALVRNPEILILDDSSSALDFATDLRLRKALAALEGQRNIFLVSQRTSSVQSADRILVLDNGKIVGFDKHENLLKNCPVYQEIYKSQFPDWKKEA